MKSWSVPKFNVLKKQSLEHRAHFRQQHCSKTPDGLNTQKVAQPPSPLPGLLLRRSGTGKNTKLKHVNKRSLTEIDDVTFCCEMVFWAIKHLVCF